MRVEEIHSVILAGGLGTRLRGVLTAIPKPMAPVEGNPFLEWVVRWLAASGVRSATLATGYRAGTIEAHFAGRTVAGLAIDCVREDRPLGTAGGFLNAVRGSGRDSCAAGSPQWRFAGVRDVAALAARVDGAGSGPGAV